MIDPDEAAFPNNAVSAIALRMGTIDEDLLVVKRQINKTDPDHCVGVYPALWSGDPGSYELGHGTPHQPTIQNYQLGIQGYVKHGDREKALAIHSVLAASIRKVLYEDALLRNNLASLVVTNGVTTESVRRWEVGAQRYLSNEIDSSFVCLSVLDYRLETEIS